MLTCRNAGLDDVDAIVALVQSAYRGESSRIGWTTEADILDGTRTDNEEVAELIKKSGSRILVCERNGELQASLHLENKGDHAYLGMFAVNPHAQGKGIGKYMLATAEEIVFKQWQCDRLEMTVISLREDLIAWYERHGYQRTGTYKPFPDCHPRYGIPRRDDLVLEVLQKRSV